MVFPILSRFSTSPSRPQPIDPSIAPEMDGSKTLQLNPIIFIPCAHFEDRENPGITTARELANLEDWEIRVPQLLVGWKL